MRRKLGRSVLAALIALALGMASGAVTTEAVASIEPCSCNGMACSVNVEENACLFSPFNGCSMNEEMNLCTTCHCGDDGEVTCEDEPGCAE
jgi:hypothetical protein